MLENVSQDTRVNLFLKTYLCHFIDWADQFSQLLTRHCHRQQQQHQRKSIERERGRGRRYLNLLISTLPHFAQSLSVIGLLLSLLSFSLFFSLSLSLSVAHTMLNAGRKTWIQMKHSSFFLYLKSWREREKDCWSVLEKQHFKSLYKSLFARSW